MSKEKEQRNKEFIRAWKEEGLSDRGLGERFTLSKFGVKSLKGRLRKKDPALYIKLPVSKPATKNATPPKRFDAKPSKSKRKHTVYLTPEQSRKLRLYAVEHDIPISEVIERLIAKEL